MQKNMKKGVKNIYLALALSVIFLFLDRFFKFWAIKNLGGDIYLYKNLLGFEPFLNPGIAFSLPVPNIITVVFSGLVIIFLLILAFLHPKNYIAPTILIIGGAISNLTDRIIYHYTVDYVRILTSIINVADILIAFGFVWLFIENIKNKEK